MTTINTDYSKQIEILEDLWTNHREDTRFEHLFDMFDFGFPLACAISQGIVESTTLAQEYIEETFNALLEICKVEDIGFEVVDQIILPE